jgi:bifunctional DNase/RNase
MKEMSVLTVGVDQAVMQPLLVLRETSGQRRLLPIWIGLPEASAIEFEREHAHSARPMTHQLLGQIISSFDRRLERVCITALRDGLFHAELLFDSDVRVSSRASDAIALALHLRVPIHAADTVLEQAALTNAQVHGIGQAEDPVPDTPIQAEELERFQRFLDTATPGDFDTG